MKRTEITSAEGIQKMIEGVHFAADIVGSTLGPKGKNVSIRQGTGFPRIINDGATILEYIKSDNKDKDSGIALLKQACQTANKISGDGSTSTALLTSAILNSYSNSIETKAAITDRMGMEKAEKDIQAKIKEYIQKITPEQYKDVAAISLGGYPEIAELISEAFKKVGVSGGIVIEKSFSKNLQLKVVDGMQLEHGIFNNYFVANQKDPEIDFDNPVILLANSRITQIQELQEALQLSVIAKRPFVVICRDIDGDALQFLIANKLQAGIPCCAVKCPGYGDGRRETFQDLGLCLNKIVFDQRSQDFYPTEEPLDFYESEKCAGESLSTWSQANLGTCPHIKIKLTNTILTFSDKQEAKQKQIEALQKLKESGELILDHDLDRLDGRISRLSGVATISISADSEVELEELRLRVEDAVNSTRSAIQRGVCVGAGYVFNEIFKYLEPQMHDKDAGYKAVVSSLVTIFDKVLSNSIAKEKIMDICNKLDSLTMFNAATGEIIPIENTPILDSAAVLQESLKAAVSVAKSLITCGYSINIYDDGVNPNLGVNPHFTPSQGSL